MTPLPPTSSLAQRLAGDAYQSLRDLFANWATLSPNDYTLVPDNHVPHPFHELLVHHQHMTERLRTFYGDPVQLAVQASEDASPLYRRRITLTAGPRNTLVELGAVRIDRTFLPEPVQAEILAQSTPLGQILINHKILRRIQPHFYLRLDSTSPLIRLFNHPTPPTLYGRIGTIFCNEQPAIELLEIVTGAPA